MKKQYLHILIAASALALVGLISVQFYWINSAISLKEEQFNRDVHEALTEVSDYLERQETLKKLHSSSPGNLLFRSIDTLVQGSQMGPDSARPDYFFVKDITQYNDRTEVRVVEERDGHRRTRVITADPTHQNSITDINIIPEENVKMPSEHTDSMWVEQLQRRTNFVGEVIKSLVQVNLFENIKDRLDSLELDSVLKASLKKQGITTDFAFGVFDNFENPILGHKELYKTELMSSAWKSRLFPNDIVEDPAYLHIYFPHKKGFILSALGAMLFLSTLLVLGVGAALYFAIFTIIRQKKLSAVKNDFINNMTHELKTPISTISLACEALSDEEILHTNSGLVKKYVGMIGEENKRLGTLVENVLQSAVWDKGEFRLKKTPLDIHQLTERVVHRVELKVKEKKGIVNIQMNAENAFVEADQVHLTNVIYNLVDNAIKYTPEHPVIDIYTANHNGSFVLSVKDNGIGISRENLKKVFDKLYRVPTGNIHNVKGFGLGLNYVKTIVEKHGGTVNAKSQPGAGSTFTINLPQIDHGN